MMRVLDVIAACRRTADGSGSMGKDGGEGGTEAGDGDGDDLPDGFLEVRGVMLYC